MFLFMFEMCSKKVSVESLLLQGRRAVRQLHFDGNTEASSKDEEREDFS